MRDTQNFIRDIYREKAGFEVGGGSAGMFSPLPHSLPFPSLSSSSPCPSLPSFFPSFSLEIKDSPYWITERMVPELIPVLGSQPVGDVSHKLGGRLPLLSARPAVTPATLKRAAI